MKFYRCACEARLFFENTNCTSCGREVGWCPYCNAIRAVEPGGDGTYRCTNTECGVQLIKCSNYLNENVCNRFLDAPGEAEFCDCCRLNDTVPDLSVEGNREKWARLEAAKRRLIYILDDLGLPYGTKEDGLDPPLSFDFKADVLPDDIVYRTMGEEERVFTGHDYGKITINIQEADDVEREKLRVDLGEAQRTLIGHFRHEIGHYYWDLLVPEQHLETFKTLFGDHENPTYQDALKRHYEEGPPDGWQQSYISSYATMHPWEDWAESFAFYLDMISVLTTAANVGLIAPVDRDDFKSMLDRFSSLGLVLNELNRTMGLLDLVPGVITPPVEEKLRLVHQVIRTATGSSPAKDAAAA
ncbi:zinc-binding metallopeptidase family protein [Minwuia sp.]|uniref:zinc-binding metallopeptidase family protein n=1 Tax=Minwuia sp. TaxID=2493630 RepID=UPI003A934C4A